MKFAVKYLHCCYEYVLNLVYPPSCLICSENVTKANSFCPRCWGCITFISVPHCVKCAISLPVDNLGDICHICEDAPPLFDMGRSVFRYDDYTKKLIYNLKFNDKTSAIASFSRLMSLYGRQLIEVSDLVIPIPLTKRKLAGRKYSQSALLAKYIAYYNHKPLKLNILIKYIDTKNQIGLSKLERQKNLGRVFKCRAPSVIKNKNILLIDDVLTTGATANACAKALKRSGANKVFILTLARTY